MADDDKHAKFEAQQNQGLMVRHLIFYTLFFTLIADCYASKAEVLNHFTLWSHIVHTLYFGLHIPSSPTLTRILHGPSLTGAHALFLAYIWTLVVNPTMEFDLAPPGRAAWLVYARAAFLHVVPIIFHWIDFAKNKKVLSDAYAGYGQGLLFQFWSMVAGYFAMGLTWEQVNGDAAGTYNVTAVSPETFVFVSKALAVFGCVGSFFVMIKPNLCKE
mmetsp:Transcript_19996/g.24005  ORF Transcript_19996/g.24005 Transcript_19996/m.24005 type:complete len:216 (-) Transcript_19996:153-800(-)